MTAALTRRGPDGDGFFFDDFVGLGHRRLAIIDVEGGAQPLYSNDRAVVGIVNGEIYNFVELRERLRARGHTFTTQSDSEVVVHGYRQWGADVLEHLEGQFAIAVWDTEQRRLLLARDRFGEKPLYWAPLPGGGLAFASELRALVRYPGVDDSVDPAALARYLVYEYTPAPYCMARGASKLAAGEALIIRPGGTPKRARYWDLPLNEAPAGGRATDLAVTALELRAELERSVTERLVSDVPLGVFLSGGLDSSLVAALAARARGGDLDTFSIGFADPSYDEAPFARQASEHIGTRHHELRVEARDLLELIPRLGELLDEPFGDGSLVPTHLLCRFAKEHVTVALGGDGADELFAGYPTFQAESMTGGTLDRMPQRVSSGIRAAGQRMAKLLPSSAANFSVDFKIKQWLRGVGAAPEHRHQAWMASLLPDELTEVLDPDVAVQARLDRIYDTTDANLRRCPSADKWDRLLAFYVTGYLADDILHKVDRASMQVSLEVRAPFLDRGVVGLACRAEPGLRAKGLETKRVLKRAARGVLPDAIIDRQKHGFGMPIAGWLRGELHELASDLLSESRLRRQGLLRPGPVARMLEEHTSARANHRKPLWTLLAFQAWLESR